MSIRESNSPGLFQETEYRSSSTIIIAASDSKHRERADYKCSGTSDNTIFTDAIAALPSSGGKIILLDGTFNFAATVTVNKSISVEGQGISTVVNSSSPAVSLFIVSADDVTFSDLKLTIPTGKQGRNCFYISEAYRFTGKNIWIHNLSGNGFLCSQTQSNHDTHHYFENIHVTAAADSDPLLPKGSSAFQIGAGIDKRCNRNTIINCWITGSGGNGIDLNGCFNIVENVKSWANGVGDIVGDKCGFLTFGTVPPSWPSETNIEQYLATGNIFINCEAWGNPEHGFYLNTYVMEDQLINCTAHDNTLDGFRVYSNYTGKEQIANCKSYKNGQHGFYLRGTKLITGNCESQENSSQGFFIAGMDNSILSNNLAERNSQNGYLLSNDGGNDENLIIGNLSKSNSAYGFQIQDAAEQNNRLIANKSIGDSSGAILDNGTGTYQRENSWNTVEDLKERVLLYPIDGSGARAAFGSYHSMYKLTAGQNAVFESWHVPSDFATIISATLVLTAGGAASGTYDWTGHSRKVANGASYAAGNESDATADGVAATLNIRQNLDVTNAFTNSTSIVVNDDIGFRFTCDALGTITEIDISHLEIVYQKVN